MTKYVQSRLLQNCRMRETGLSLILNQQNVFEYWHGKHCQIGRNDQTVLQDTLKEDWMTYWLKTFQEKKRGLIRLISAAFHESFHCHLQQRCQIMDWVKMENLIPRLETVVLCIFYLTSANSWQLCRLSVPLFITSNWLFRKCIIFLMINSLYLSFLYYN